VRVGSHLRDQAHKPVVRFPQGGGNIGEGRDESAPSGNEASKPLGKGWEATASGNETCAGYLGYPFEKRAFMMVLPVLFLGNLQIRQVLLSTPA